jgi:hypothetical protein
MTDAPRWRPIAEAPRDGTRVLVWAAPYDDLEGFHTIAAYHADAGWCVCELRYVTHWMPLPAPPED